MPRTFPPTGSPCWFELASTNPAVSAAFHRELFGWTTADMDLGPMGTYSFLRNAGGKIGALCGLPPGAPPQSGWNVYFGVTDVDAATSRAREFGARVTFEPFDVAEHGRMATLVDPTGAAFSLWQSRSPEGSGDFTMFEDHAIGWVELATRDARAAQLGGKVCVPAFDAPGVGRIARIDDPTGAGAYVIRLEQH